MLILKQKNGRQLMNNLRAFGIFEGEGNEPVGIVETTNTALGAEDALKAYAKHLNYEQDSPIMAHSQGIYGDGDYPHTPGNTQIVARLVPTTITME